ncbi:MAG: tetratricopeptide repeat protein [Elusimicrobia bacterium]|nr:tetratricopeptide repeat protein [Elusimicrobiota bacterium]
MMKQEGIPAGELPEGMTDAALNEAIRLTQQAAELNDAKQYGKAANSAEQALAANPRSATAWFHKAYALDALDHDAEALAAYDEALRLCPDYDHAWKNKAGLLCELKRFEESLACWDRVIELNPGEGRWLDQKAKALVRLNRADEAAELTIKALEDPAFAAEYEKGHDEMLAMMGMTRVEMTPEEQAATLDAVLNRDLGSAPAAVREEAERFARQAAAAENPAHPEALQWLEKGRAQLADRTPEGAKKALASVEQCLALSPDLPMGLFLRASALYVLGRVCAAGRDFKRFKELAHADMGKQLEAADLVLGDIKKAGVPLEAIEAEEERRIDEAVRIFGGVDSARSPQESLTLCETVLRLHAAYAGAWLVKAQALEGLGRQEEAQAAYAESGRLVPDFAEPWGRGAKLLVRRGKLPDTVAWCDRALASVLAGPERLDLRMIRTLGLLVTPGRQAEGNSEIDALLKEPGLSEAHRAALTQARSGLKAGPEAQAVETTGAGHGVARATAASQEGAAAPGTELLGGKYEVLGVLGEGGFGVVYRVYSRETRMVYALKTFREEYLADAGTRDLFKKEAQVWLDLGAHPYVVRAHYVDELNGRLYIAMEYLPGDRERPNSLEGWLRKGPVELDRLLRWSVQFCHGMEHSARRGIQAHRDIKPANILVARDGTLRISDFGLAAALNLAKSANRLAVKGDGVGLSCMGEGGAGTPPFMPPEQFASDGRCDARSDVYAFGVTMYQLLSGRFPLMPRPPGRAPDDGRRFWSEMRMMASTMPPPPLDTPLWPVIAKCLAKKPQERFASFAELRAPLEEYLKAMTGEAVVPPAMEKLGASEWNNRGISLNDLDRFEDAAACFDRALDASPNDPMVLANKALALRGQGKFDEALACADRSLALGRSAAGWNHRGLVLLDLGRLDDAAESFADSLKADAGLLDAWLNLGLVQQRRSAHDPALQAFEKALAVEPKSAAAWAGKGLSLDKLGRADEALEAYGKAVELDPRRASAWLNLGILTRRKGDAKTALVHYQKAFELDPDSPVLWFNLGVAEEDLGDLETAAKAYVKFLQLKPGDALAAQVKHATGRLEAFSAKARPAPPPGQGPIGPADKAEAMYLNACEQFRNGEHAKAVSTLNAGMYLIDGKSAKMWALHSAASAALGKHEAALDSIGKALDLEPNAEWTAARAGLLLTLGRLDEALDACGAALAADPKLGAAWAHRGGAFARQGKPAEALEAFNRAAELAPQLADVWRQKAALEDAARRPLDAAASLREFLRRVSAKDVGAIDRAKEDLRRLESGGAKPTPEQLALWLEKATILFNQGKWDLAREPLQRALDADDSNTRAWRDLARCLLELRRPEEAERAAAAAAERDPSDGEACLLRGEAFEVRGLLAEALAAYEESLARQPGSARARVAKGRALLAAAAQGGDAHALTLGALEEFDGALSLEPRLFVARYLKGTAHHALGQTDEAVKAFRQFMATAPITQRQTMDEVRERLKALGAA